MAEITSATLIVFIYKTIKLEELFGGHENEEIFEQKFGENEVILFAVNRSESEELSIDVDLEGFTNLKVIESTELAGYDVKMTLDKDHEAMEIKENNTFKSEGMNVTGTFKPLSWNMVRLKY